LGSDAKDVTPTLIDFLKDTTITSVDKTTTSAQTSGKEGKTGSATVQESGTEDARPAAARALAHIGKGAGPAARKALEEAAEDPTSEKLRAEAKKALGSFR
jgi:HEAT repeat protein